MPLKKSIEMSFVTPGGRGFSVFAQGGLVYSCFEESGMPVLFLN